MKKNHHNKKVNMKRYFGILTILTFLFAFDSAYAAVQENVPRISIQELKQMMDKGTDMTILDIQPKEVYEMGHIKGALSFPWKSKISMQDVRSLPRNKPIITYCDCGPGESDSADIASQLILLGFRDVKVLQDPAIQGWREAGYPMEGK